jgi:hypothetical protein
MSGALGMLVFSLAVAPSPLAEEPDCSPTNWMPGANLAGCNLLNANLEDKDLSNANLTGANLNGAQLSRATLTNATLTGATFSGAEIYDTTVGPTGAALVYRPSGAGFNGPDLTVSNTAPSFSSASFVIPSVALGRSVVSISAQAFLNVTTLTGTLTLPNSVTSIDLSAFQGTLINALDLGSVTSIGAGAFYAITTLTGTLNLPSSVNEIGQDAFFGTKFSGALVVPASITAIGPRAFSGNRFNSLAFETGSRLTAIPDDAFAHVSTFRGDLSVPSGVTTIGVSAFYDAGFDGILTLPNDLTSIGAGAFYGSNFNAVLIGERLESIGDEAFAARTEAGGTFTFNGPAPTLGSGAFAGADGLTIRYREGAAGWTALRNQDPNPFGADVTWVEIPAPPPPPGPAPAPVPGPNPPPPSANPPAGESFAPPTSQPSGLTPGESVPTVPTVQPPGTSGMFVDGQPVEVSQRVGPADRGLVLEALGMNLEFSSTTQDGRPLPLAPDGTLNLARTGAVPISGSGLLPGALMNAALFSEESLLGSTAVNSAGDFALTAVIPGTVPRGIHTLQLTGWTAAAKPFVLSIGVTVTSPAAALGANPTLIVTPKRATKGMRVTVRISGVQAFCRVTIRFGDQQRIEKASSTGKASATFTATRRGNTATVRARVHGKGCDRLKVHARAT